MIAITHLSMVTELAGFVFSNTYHSNRRVNDKTLEAVARILLEKRGYHLWIFNDSFDTSADFSNDLATSIKNMMGLDSTETDELRIITVMGEEREFFKNVKAEMLGDGFLAVPAISQYISGRTRESDIFFASYPEQRISVLFVTDDSVELQHTIASILPALVPWAFKDQPRTKQEEEALMALGDFNTGVNEIIRKLEELSEPYNLDKEAAQYYFHDFESRVRNKLVRETTKEIEQLEREIEELHKGLSKRIERRYEQNAYLKGLLTMEEENGSCLADYFDKNEKLQVIGREDEDVTYVVAGYMDLFDVEAYDMLRENKMSYLYEGYKQTRLPRISGSDYLLLMDALFKEEKVKLKLCSAWQISAFEIKCISGYNFPTKYDDYMPNSHIDGFGCYGSFREDLEKAIANHDYEYAVDISSAENGNINLNDAVVIPNKFIPGLLRSDKKIIELPDGRSVTVVDAVEWIKKEENDGEDN